MLILPDDLMVSVSGFRGRIGAPLTPELIGGIAAHFGAFLRSEGEAGPVVVGRDSRTSGPMLVRAAVAGLQSVGVDVVEVGVVPTPTVLMAVRHHGAAGGVGVTASHNPAEWNALKLSGPDGMFLDADRSLRFRTFLAESDASRAGWDELGEVRDDPEAVDRHLEAILDLSFLDVEGLRGRGFRVALDCVRGAGGTIVPRLLEELGCIVEGLYLEPTGRFPRNPEPSPERLRELGDRVRDTGAAVGFAVDPDVDRLALVADDGTPLGEDLTLALAAAAVLERNGGGTVVTNLSTSRVVEDVADRYGGRLVRSPVGEIHVARRMESEGAVVGGEGNGGVILPELHLTRDASVGVALILQYLLDEGASLRELVARLPEYRIVKEKVAFPREALEGAYRALEEDLGPEETDRSDGLRLDWPSRSAWLHVRPSGTEPVVRLIAEAPDQERARALVERGRQLLEGVL